jgi:hypothetical protein
MHQVYTLVGFAFGRGLAEQDTLDDSRHLIASFFAVDALDKGFGAGRFSVVHEHSGEIIRSRAKTHET